MSNFKQKAFEDILASGVLSKRDLVDYLTKESGQIFYVYKPFVVRNEGQKMVFSIKFEFSDNNSILARYVDERFEPSGVNSSSGLAEKEWRGQIEQFVQEHQVLFKNYTKKPTLEELLSCYEVEVVVQEGGFRLRLRKLFSVQIVLDLWIENGSSLSKYNVYIKADQLDPSIKTE